MSRVKKAVKITKQLCTNALCIIDRGLSSGLNDGNGKVCIEYAIAIASGTPEDKDGPRCVNRWLRDVKIYLNDNALWNNPRDRAKGLRRLGIAQLGTDKQVNFKKRFIKELVKLNEEMLVKFPLPKGREYGTVARLYLTSPIKFYWFMVNQLDFYEYPNLAGVPEPRKSVDHLRFTHAYTEGLVQILIKMRSPGSKYLYLTEGKRKFTLPKNLAAALEEAAKW
jgi:hypothetical protein